MPRSPLFGGKKTSSGDAARPPVSPGEAGAAMASPSPFQDAAHAASQAAGASFAPPPPAARSFSRLLSGAVADLSYLADPGGAVEDGGGDVTDSGRPPPTSPRPATHGGVSFSPLATAASGGGGGAAAVQLPPAPPPRLSFPAAEKAVFTGSLVTICLAAFWLGASPFSFYRLYTLAVAILLPLRFFTYRRARAHLYLLDLCYVANGVTLWALWGAPTSLTARHAAHALGAGPLLWAIPAFRNAAVFHDADKMTSLFIHAGPALVAWTGRWRPGPLVGLAPSAAAAAAARAVAARVGLGGGWRHASHTAVAGPAAQWGWWGRRRASSAMPSSLADLPPGWDAATPLDLLAAAAPIYLAWAVPYYLFLFVFGARRIADRGYATLYGYLTRHPEGAVTRAVAGFPPGARPAAFMAFHAAGTAAAVAFSAAAWSSYTLHTALILGAVIVSAINGAGFYEYLIVKARAAGVREGASGGGAGVR